MKSLVCTLLVVAASAAAEAAPARQTAAEARVEWRNEPKPTVFVDDEVWHCDGDICKGPLIDKPFLKLRACRTIARQLARVTGFSSASGPLGEEDLKRCNGKGR
jgi:hypothetical protein